MRRRLVLACLPLLAAPWPGAARAQATAPPAAGASAPAGGAAPARGVPAGRVLRLPVFNANILRANRTRGVISVESALDVPDPKLSARIRMMSPRFKSDLSRRLALYAANVPPGHPPDLDVLTPILQRQVDATAGQPGARLLILNVIVN